MSFRYTHLRIPLILTAASEFCSPLSIISLALLGALNAPTMKSDAAVATTSWFDSSNNSHATGSISAICSSVSITIDFMIIANGEWKLSFTCKTMIREMESGVINASHSRLLGLTSFRTLLYSLSISLSISLSHLSLTSSTSTNKTHLGLYVF